MNCPGSFDELVYTAMNLTSNALDAKFPGKIQLYFASQ